MDTLLFAGATISHRPETLFYQLISDDSPVPFAQYGLSMAGIVM
jgi:hypothetical protein